MNDEEMTKQNYDLPVSLLYLLNTSKIKQNCRS